MTDQMLLCDSCGEDQWPDDCWQFDWLDGGTGVAVCEYCTARRFGPQSVEVFCRFVPPDQRPWRWRSYRPPAGMEFRIICTDGGSQPRGGS